MPGGHRECSLGLRHLNGSASWSQWCNLMYSTRTLSGTDLPSVSEIVRERLSGGLSNRELWRVREFERRKRRNSKGSGCE